MDPYPSPTPHLPHKQENRRIPVLPIWVSSCNWRRSINTIWCSSSKRRGWGMGGVVVEWGGTLVGRRVIVIRWGTRMMMTIVSIMPIGQLSQGEYWTHLLSLGLCDYPSLFDYYFSHLSYSTIFSTFQSSQPSDSYAYDGGPRQHHQPQQQQQPQQQITHNSSQTFTPKNRRHSQHHHPSPRTNSYSKKKPLSSSTNFSPTSINADLNSCTGSNGTLNTPPPRHSSKKSLSHDTEVWYQKWWMCGFTDALNLNPKCLDWEIIFLYFSIFVTFLYYSICACRYVDERSKLEKAQHTQCIVIYLSYSYTHYISM